MTEQTRIEDLLKNGGVYTSTTSGVSMMPMLRNRRDTIIVVATTDRLKKYDVALYRRKDDYVLHRVIKVLPESYVIRGDNCIAKEYGITDADVLGKLVEFYRDDKKINMEGKPYRIYCFLVVAFHPLVRLYAIARGKLASRKGKKS